MKKSRQPSFTRKSPVLASLALACALSSVSTSAFAFSDVPAFGQRLVEFIETTRKRIQEYTDAIATMNHYKQQVSELGNMLNLANLSLAPHPMENATVRSLSYGMERCDKGASNSGLDLTSLITSLLPVGNQSFVQEQKDICRKIVLLENYKYNDLVNAMKDLKKLKEQGHYKVVQEANSASTQSKNETSTVAAINTLTAVQIQYANIEYTTKIYDDMIAALNEQMKNSANKAMKGEKSFGEAMLSSAFSMVALKGVLEAQKSSCPSGFDCD